MAQSITLINYGAGNIGSLISAFEYIGCSVNVTSTPRGIHKASTLVLPGVGSFDTASEQLFRQDLVGAIREAVLVEKKKILGICLGMQLFFDSSEEGIGSARGLQILPQKVMRLRNLNQLTLPHVGYNSVCISDYDAMHTDIEQSGLLKGINNPFFYFVHSYRVAITEHMPGLQLKTVYGEAFLSGYEHENIFLTQFHPEKSQTNGLQLLTNFIKL